MYKYKEKNYVYLIGGVMRMVLLIMRQKRIKIKSLRNECTFFQREYNRWREHQKEITLCV